jgi:ankyrin repeat protein
MNEDLAGAIRTGDVARVNTLLDAHPELLHARDTNGVSAISMAMYHGQPEIARTFIGRGAALDLFEACAAGVPDTVRDLVPQHGVNAISSDGFPALGLACFFGHEDIARYLLDAGADPNLAATNSFQVRPIHAATARRSEAIVRLLLERGADPNSRQQNGFTALHAAAQNGDTAIIDLLLQHGADPALTSDNGKTAAELASNPAIADRLRR